MKSILKWVGRVCGGALSFILVIVLTPYASSLAQFILPDVTGAQVKNAAILSQQMRESARLETMTVEGEGAINAETQAAFLGTVSTLNATYTYHGSYGVDLSKVQVEVRGNKLTFILPQPELIRDDITLGEIYRSGAYDRAVRVDDNGLQSLLDEERTKWRDQYLTGEHAAELQTATITAFEKTIASWMSRINGRLEYDFRWAAPVPTE